MTILDHVWVQLLQPYFFYSLVFLAVTFVSIKIITKFSPLNSRRLQSAIWLIPLFIPVCVLLIFPPQIVIIASHVLPKLSAVSGMSAMWLTGPPLFSLTGLICIIGVGAAVSYLVVMVFFGKTLALKRFHVILMTENENVALQEKVKTTAHKLGVTTPQVGLVDDLMPNAFTMGYGRGAVVVFSLGLLQMLNSEEIDAVISHELAHIKAKDGLFRTLVFALNFLSFFNPLSYFAASQAQKERELLADQTSVALLDKPDLMSNVLTKIEAATQAFPKPCLMDQISTRLFLVSPLAHRSRIFATHPQISHRIQNIKATTSTSKKPRCKFVAGVLLLVLFSAALVTGYSAVQFQKEFSQNAQPAILGDKVLLYNSTLCDPVGSRCGMIFDGVASLENFLACLTDENYRLVSPDVDGTKPLTDLIAGI